MLSRQKGAIAEVNAISYFTTMGYKVFLPIGTISDYDLVVEKEGVFARIQVKYAGLYNQKTKCQAALRVMGGGNQSYYTAKKYTDNAFDYLFVYTAKREHFLVPWKEITARSQISIEAPKYSTYKIIMQG